MPFSRKIGSASGVVGPLAPSRMIFALMRGAFSFVKTLSSAAGSSTSHSSSSAAAELSRLVAPGKSRIDPVALRWLKTSSSFRPFAFMIAPSRSAIAMIYGAALAAEFRGVIADVAEALDDDPLAVEAARQSEPLHFVRLVAGFAKGEIQAAARGFLASAHAALRHRLAGHAAEGIELPGIERGIGVGHPRHLALAGAVVRRRHVDAGAEEALLGELVRVAAGDALELVERIILRLDLDAALRAAKRHVDDRALVGHQCGQRHDLFFVHLGAVTDAALDRHLVVAVLDAPRVDHFDLAAGAAQREVEAIDAVADANLLEQAARVVGELRGFAEVLGDLIEEVRLSAHG